MITANLAFHMAALVAFAALLSWLLNLKARLQLVQNLRRAQFADQPIVQLRDPLKFLVECAQALDIAISMDGKLPSENREKIFLSDYANLLLHHQICEIKFSGGANKNTRGTISLRIKGNKENEHLANVIKKLRTNINISITTQ